MRVLVTGPTGAIGLPLVKELAKRGHDVTVLARPKPTRTFDDVRRLLPKRVELIVGDITEPMCGVPLGTIGRNVGRFDVMIHAAGVTQYHESLRNQTFSVNEGGTQNALSLAQMLEIGLFAFISTAYVAGGRPHFGENEIGATDDTRNPYEASKIKAEEHVRNYPGDHLILRLSTVIGHSRTGYIVNAGGYAGFTKTFWAFRTGFEMFPQNPFWAGVNPGSRMNLLPNDWAMWGIVSPIERGLIGNVHVTHPHPVSMKWLFEQTFGHLPLTYDRNLMERTARWDDPKWAKIQTGIAKAVEYFGPYVQHDTTFEHERLKALPGYQPPSMVDEAMIKVQLDYMSKYLFPKRRLEIVAA